MTRNDHESRERQRTLIKDTILEEALKILHQDASKFWECPECGSKTVEIKRDFSMIRCTSCEYEEVIKNDERNT